MYVAAYFEQYVRIKNYIIYTYIYIHINSCMHMKMYV